MMAKESSSINMNCIKFVSVIILTLIPLILISSLLKGIVNLPSYWVSTSFLLSGLVLFAGWISLIFTKSVRVWAYCLVILTVLVVGTVISSLVVSISVVLGPVGYPAAVGGSTCLVIAYLYMRQKQRQLGPSLVSEPGTVTSAITTLQPRSKVGTLVSGIEVTSIPSEYLECTSADTKPFEAVLRHALISGVPIALRIQRIGLEKRLIFLTWGADRTQVDQQARVMLDSLRSNLPTFQFSYKEHIGSVSSSHFAAGTVTGVPLSIYGEAQQKRGLSASAEIINMLEDVVIQISFETRGTNASEVRSLEQAYRHALSNSETTVSRDRKSLFSDDHTESQTLVDMDARRKAERLKRQVERLSDKYLCKTSVNVISWGPSDADARQKVSRVVGSIVSSFKPDDKNEDFKAHAISKRSEIDRVLQGLPSSQSSVLTIDEALNYFMLPPVDVGIEVSRRSSFSTATQEPPVPEKNATPQPLTLFDIMWKTDVPAVVLGNPLSKSGSPLAGLILWLLKEDLKSHLAIFGNTQSGKTETAQSIFAQACRCGISPLTIVPVKCHEWRRMKDLFPSLRYFTADKAHVAPLRYNPLNVPDGVRIGKWVPVVRDIMTAYLPIDSIMKMHLSRVIRTMFRNCGWSASDDIRGRPILLTDLYEAAVEVGESLTYGSEVHQNFIGAIESRIRALLEDPLMVEIFNTTEGITIPELLSQPTIIEIEDLGDNEKLLFTGLLTAAIGEYYLAHPQEELKNLLVLEEAHFLLKQTGKMENEGRSAQDEAIAEIVEMLRTCGGTGLGIVIIDQIPSSLVAEAVKLPVNIICHALGARADRELVGKHMRCSDAQIEHIGGMRQGEAIVYIQRLREPKNIKMMRLDKLLEKVPAKRTWINEMIRQSMSKTYEEHPRWLSYTPVPEDIFDEPPKLHEAPRPEVKRPQVSADYLHTVAESERLIKTLTEKLSTCKSRDVYEWVVTFLGNVLRSPASKETVQEFLLILLADCDDAAMRSALLELVRMARA